MAIMMTRVQVDDYDAWRRVFDTDPPGARAAAKGHRLFRLVEDPSEVLIVVEFDTTDDAIAAREKLLASGVLDHVRVTGPPTIADEADAVVR